MKNNSVFTIIFLYTVLGCFGVSAEPVRFVVVGDLPYSKDQARVFESEIRPAIAAGNFLLPFILVISRLAVLIALRSGSLPPTTGS